MRFTDAFTPVSMIEPYVDGHGDFGKGKKKSHMFSTSSSATVSCCV